MNAFKKKSLCLAIAAGLGAVGMAGTASAVNINSNGLGQALIYPYFTVRNNQNTYVSVVNTTNQAKAVKVRWLESRNSREVLDFNLYLSAYDTWTAAVIPTANGAGARMITADRSCTQPMAAATTGEVGNGWNFANTTFTGAAVAGLFSATFGIDGVAGSDSLDRTKEGYMEIIEMGVVTHPAILSAITHNSAGFPANCLLLQTASASGLDGLGGMAVGGPTPLAPPTGGLAGTGTVILPATGFAASYDPVALAAFSATNLWTVPGSIRPSMIDANPARSVVFKNGAAITSNWTATTADAVSSVLMHDNLINEIIMDTNTQSTTDWVITMPTKRHYVPVQIPGGAVQATLPPFTSKFWITGATTPWTGGACETVAVQYWDREEQTPSGPAPVLLPSPLPPVIPATPNSLCWEITVMTFNNGNVLGSGNLVSLPVTFATTQSGWAKMALPGLAAGLSSIDPVPNNFKGLPVAGFAVQTFTNTGVVSKYAGVLHHKSTTNINGSLAD